MTLAAGGQDRRVAGLKREVGEPVGPEPRPKN